MKETKIAILFVAFLIVLSSSSIITPLLYEFNADDNYKQPVVQSIETADPKDIRPLMKNINPNPGMEESYSNNVPDDYGYYATAHIYANDMYQDLTHSGSYSGYVEARGSASSANPYIRQYLAGNPERAFLTDGLQLDFFVYLLENPDLARGAWSYLWMSFYNGVNTRIIGYVFSLGNYIPSNYTSGVYYLMNQTSYSWVNLVRNVTADYIAYYGAPESNRYLYDLYFYAISPSFSTKVTSFVVDDISLTNRTAFEFIPNSGFESGDGSYWFFYLTSPGYIQQTTDCVEGSYALNLSVSSIRQNAYGVAQFYRNYYYPHGLYPTEPGELFISFDWKYSDSEVADYDQFARLTLLFQNGTSTYNLYYYLGSYEDYFSFSNSTYSKYFHSPSYGLRDVWVHEAFDVSVLAASAGFAKDVGLYHMEFQINIGYMSTSYVELLIDDFNIVTYPAVDPGFEQDWNDQTYHLTSWAAWDGQLGDFSRSTDAHSGNYALNLTASDYHVAVQRYNMECDIDPSMMTDFWWRIDELEGEYGYGYIRLFFNDAEYYLDYLVADINYGGYNSSNSVTYNMEEMNSIGTWYNIQRNITHDLNIAFGEHDWKMNYIVIGLFLGWSSMSSILFDDINFLDKQPPDILDVHRSTAVPVYYEPVEIWIETVDNLAGVWGVQIFYNTGASWNSVFADLLIGDIYEAIIPIYPYDTFVQYYANVTDYCGTSAIDDKGGEYYSYTVEDDVNPSVTLERPYNESITSGNVHFQATASDVGSGIGHVDFYVDTMLVFSDLSAPYEYDWDSRSVVNGSYIIRAEAFDNAGMKTSASSVIHVENDVASPVLSIALINPTIPEITDTVRVSIAASDATGIENVTLHYRFGDSPWTSQLMVSSGGLYYADIPQTDEVIHVSFYIVAFDVFGQVSTRGTELAPLGYDVIDTEGFTLPPSISNVMLNPTTPEYVDTVTISIMVTDAGMVTQVRIYYRFDDGSWTSASMESSGPLYYYEISPRDFGTEVEFYIEATNDRGLNSSLGTISEPLSYIVDDFTQPVVSIFGPISGTNVSGVISFDISALDVGSGIEQITIHIDGVLEQEGTGGSLHFDWNTALFLNEGHTILITVTDNAGNSATIELMYVVQNPLGLDMVVSALGSFMASYGFFVGFGMIAVLYFGVPYLLRRRVASKAA